MKLRRREDADIQTSRSILRKIARESMEKTNMKMFPLPEESFYFYSFADFAAGKTEETHGESIPSCCDD